MDLCPLSIIFVFTGELRVLEFVQHLRDSGRRLGQHRLDRNASYEVYMLVNILGHDKAISYGSQIVLCIYQSTYKITTRRARNLRMAWRGIDCAQDYSLLLT